MVARFRNIKKRDIEDSDIKKYGNEEIARAIKQVL